MKLGCRAYSSGGSGGGGKLKEFREAQEYLRAGITLEFFEVKDVYILTSPSVHDLTKKPYSRSIALLQLMRL